MRWSDILFFLRRYPFGVVISLYAAGILALHAAGLFPRPGAHDISRLIGSAQITLEGRITNFPVTRWNQTRFLFEGRAVPPNDFRGKVIVTLAFPQRDLAPGDVLRLRGWPSAPRPATRRRDFDEERYWASQRVFTMLKVWSPEGLTITRSAPAWTLARAAWRFHNRYREFWEHVLPPDEAALLLGITIGARGVLPQHLKDACIRAGVYHIVVVSGQNMSLIVMLGVAALLLFRVPRRRALWICAGPIIFYAAAVGGDPPVVRAAVMAIVGLLAVALGRDTPRFYPLLLAAGWILLGEPETLLGASFQLSFGAVLSLLALLPLAEPFLAACPRPTRWLVQAGLMGLAVHIGIWPLLVYYFHRLSLAGFLANWTIFPLSGLLMVLGLVIGTWGVLWPAGVPEFLIHLTEMLVRLSLALIERMSRWSWAVVPLRAPPVFFVGLYYAVLFGILFFVRRKQIHVQNHSSLFPRRHRF